MHLGGNGEPDDVRMIRLADGRVARLAHSALDRLVACCGDQQPGLLVDVSR